ncbi:TonB-dependent receptor domain-containing protein [Persicobacter psychrovividus]|uniref:TonB-dependent receptor n=1 Tax=Persicobacter psychrovividus TaxID=387638 RepID=A0ABM7VIW6_9BACT|nr:TonB-dependent receptor [Persicobacter psychrovividus]
MIRSLFLSLLFLIFSLNVSAQANRTVKGILIDAETKSALPYASVMVHAADSDEMLSGAISDSQGKFTVKGLTAGKYLIKVKFMGYKTLETATFELSKPSFNAGTLSVVPSVQVMDGVEVKAKRAAVDYNIDRKVLNVAAISTALGGTAVEVLENLPAVAVDAEGNVSLRGSTNFTVFIDGRPSVFTGSEALQQLPASTIEKIEVITNPSAKYDPDGTAGIINIITKKKVKGFSGVANLHGGNLGRLGADAMFTYKVKKWNLYFGGDYNKRVRAGKSESENNSYFGDTTYTVRQEGDRSRWFDPYSVKGGFDYNLSDNDLVTLMVSAGRFGMGSQSNTDIINTTTINGIEQDRVLSESDQEGNIDWRYLSADFNYQHKFTKEGHTLDIGGMYRGSDMNQFDRGVNTTASGAYERPAQLSTEEKQGQEWRVKADYVLPIAENNKLELGYQGRFEQTSGNNEISFRTEPSVDWDLQDEFSYRNEFYRNIQAVYGMFNGKVSDFGYQLGLRGEYTDRQVSILDTNEDFEVNRFDYFPTAHFSYQLPHQQQLMLSYSKRINRPRSYYLEPFLTFRDQYNVRSGNPDLLPEYIHSMELGYQKNIADFMFSLEGYYRMTENSVQWVQSVFQEDIFLSMPENVGEEHTTGVELMISGPVAKWWNMNLSGNFGTYRLTGEFEGRSFDRSNITGSVRFNNDFTVLPTTKLQFGMQYNAPTIIAQGERSATFTANMAIKQELIKNQLSLTLSGRNIFGTFQRESFTSGENFNNYSLLDARTFIEGTLSYRINNYKVKRNGRGGGMEGSGGDW